VPIQCNADGALRIADQDVATGSNGAIKGASAATTKAIMMTRSPATAAGRRAKRAIASRVGARITPASAAD